LDRCGNEFRGTYRNGYKVYTLTVTFNQYRIMISFCRFYRYPAGTTGFLANLTRAALQTNLPLARVTSLRRTEQGKLRQTFILACKYENVEVHLCRIVFKTFKSRCVN
jgi:hypothetical protein